MAYKSKPETLREFEAFEFWYWSEPRTFERVAKQFGVTEPAVRKWSLKHAWEKRAAERDAKIKEQIAAKNDAESIKRREQFIKIGQAVVSRFGARLLKDAAKRQEAGVSAYEPTALDAARWAQFVTVLDGGVSNRSEVSLGKGFVDAFLTTVTATLRREIPRACPHCHQGLDFPERASKALQDASSRLLSEQADVAGAAAAPVEGRA